MKYKVKKVHFVGIGGADMSSEQGPARSAGCERPRVAPAADARSQGRNT
jgi:hypothetical protein